MSEATTILGTCAWCEMRDTPVNADGLCDMCREPSPEPQKTFDTSAISERLNEIDARFLEPFIKKAADNFYCQVLDTVDGYLIENLDYNMSSHIKMLERENQRFRTELWEVDKALGCHSLGHQTRLNGIKENQDRTNQALGENWRLRGVLAELIGALRDFEKEYLPSGLRDSREWQAVTALAAATGTAKTAKLAECEASQSGGCETAATPKTNDE